MCPRAEQREPKEGVPEVLGAGGHSGQQGNLQAFLCLVVIEIICGVVFGKTLSACIGLA